MLSFVHFLGIAHWTDIAEILLLSTLIYTFSLWLRQDQNITLLVYFYSACGLFIVASLFHLQAIV
jgi:DNA integrity scanning protein DisA with diadenylate cyclase activity